MAIKIQFPHAFIDVDCFKQLRLQHGDIFYWNEFGTHYLLLNSYSAIREALVLSEGGGEVFAGGMESLYKKIVFKNRGKIDFNISVY